MPNIFGIPKKKQVIDLKKKNLRMDIKMIKCRKNAFHGNPDAIVNFSILQYGFYGYKNLTFNDTMPSIRGGGLP